MKLEIRNNEVEISGYVNITMRDSKPIRENGKMFLEQVNRGVFKRALETADDVDVLLNHDDSRKLSSRNDGFEMREDELGLYVRGTISDAEFVNEAREDKLTGFSFGFICLKESREEINKDNCKERRYLEEIKLNEISILDYRKRPAYSGCLIETRSEDGQEVKTEFRSIDDLEVVDNTKSEKAIYDNSKYKEILNKIRK